MLQRNFSMLMGNRLTPDAVLQNSFLPDSKYPDVTAQQAGIST
jgi:hypothetical protein